GRGTRSSGLRMRNGSGGCPDSPRQPAHGQLSRKCFQVYVLAWPSFHRMMRRSAPSLLRDTGNTEAGPDAVIVIVSSGERKADTRFIIRNCPQTGSGVLRPILVSPFA